MANAIPAGTDKPVDKAPAPVDKAPKPKKVEDTVDELAKYKDPKGAKLGNHDAVRKDN